MTYMTTKELLKSLTEQEVKPKDGDTTIMYQGLYYLEVPAGMKATIKLEKLKEQEEG